MKRKRSAGERVSERVSEWARVSHAMAEGKRSWSRPCCVPKRID